ncbi:hypothetical protein ES707_21291 [subsurface metagenome]
MVVAVAVMFSLPGAISAVEIGDTWVEDGEPGPEGPEGPVGETGSEGATGSTGGTGARGATGRSGKDIVRMFSQDGGDKDPWSLTSESVDKYMLESTTYAGKTTHIIVEIVFMVEQANGSLVFMSK